MCLSTRFANKDDRAVRRATEPHFSPFFLSGKHRPPFTSLPLQGSQGSERARFIIEESGPLGREVQVPNEEKEGYAL